MMFIYDGYTNLYSDFSKGLHCRFSLPSSYVDMKNDFRRWIRIVTFDALTAACRLQLTHHMNSPPSHVYRLSLLIFFLSFFFLFFLPFLLVTFIIVSSGRLAQVNLGQTRQWSFHKKMIMLQKKRERANVHLNQVEEKETKPSDRRLDDDQS